MKETEANNPATREIDKFSTRGILEAVNREDETVAGAVKAAIGSIADCVDEIAAKLSAGGRLIYCGCGTSGRLAVADAAECGPTFGAEGAVLAVIAGGQAAIGKAMESCEDDFSAGRRACAHAEVTARDFVLGVSANGGAPFTIGFMREAKDRGAAVAALVNNPDTEMERVADRAIVVRTGAEVIQGSTRMKAGTAQKLTLNMISTAVFIKNKRVYGNLMTEANISNGKLRERAVAMVREASGADARTAEKALNENDWHVRQAIAACKGEGI